jgi:CRP-like cAMP-binding protein
MKFLPVNGETANHPYEMNDSLGLRAARVQQNLYSECSLHIYSPSVELFKQGDVAREVYFIDSGIVKLVHHDRDGQEMILGLRTPNWVLGAAPALLEKPFPASAQTLTSCCLRRMATEVFLHLIRSDAEFSWRIHQIQSDEIYDETMHVAQLGRCSARDRLEQLLWKLAAAVKPAETAKETRLQLPLRHWEVAELLAITPQHLSRVLKQMQQEGVIRQHKGWLIIPDVRKLYHSVD